MLAGPPRLYQRIETFACQGGLFLTVQRGWLSGGSLCPSFVAHAVGFQADRAAAINVLTFPEGIALRGISPCRKTIISIA